MAISTTTQRNNVATAYGTSATFAALFTADPGTSGSVTGEVSGGSPAYARKAITWSAPSNGVITGTVTFDVPAGATVTYAGVASAATGANLLDRVAVTSQAFSTQGSYQLSLTYTQS